MRSNTQESREERCRNFIFDDKRYRTVLFAKYSTISSHPAPFAPLRRGFVPFQVGFFIFSINVLFIDSVSFRDSSEVKIKILEVVKLVLDKTEIRQVTALKTILIILCKEVYQFQTGQLIKVSEELQIAVLNCIEAVNRRASSDCIEGFFRNENSSQICQIMYLLLSLVDTQDYREIKLRSLDALMALLHVDDSSDSADIVLRNQISGIIFFALPMIWKSLTVLILNDPKIGTRVIEVRFSVTA